MSGFVKRATARLEEKSMDDLFKNIAIMLALLLVVWIVGMAIGIHC